MKAVFFALFLLILFGSFFAAFAKPLDTKPTAKAKERAKELKASARLFRLDLNYQGDQDKPYYGLTLSVPLVPQLALDPFHPIVQITEEEAVKLIDQLTEAGFLDQVKEKAPAERPCYALMVRASGKAKVGELWENLGWGNSMLKRLGVIQAVLPDSAAKSMNLLVGRLEGHRKEWAK